MSAGPDILIFDDDPISAELLAAVAQEAGFSCEKFLNGSVAVEKIKALKPRAVVLDLMMPGMDGISILRAVKAMPETASIPVIVASGKPFKEDREQALRCGAATFFQKPLDCAKFLQALISIIGQGRAPWAPSTPPPATSRAPAFEAKVWGARSIGGAEPSCCVSVSFGDRLLILDAGTGMEGLCSNPPASVRETSLLLTHYHPGHIEGFKALARLDAPERKFLVGGPADTQGTLHRLARETLAAAAPRSRIVTLSEARFQLWPDVGLSALLTRHPDATLAYRVEHKGHSLVYCPANEPEVDEEIPTDYPEKLGRFVCGADVLIHDSRFSDEDYPSNKDRGHACPRTSIDASASEGVHRLVLFHLDARYSPKDLEKILEGARAKLQTSFSTMGVDLAAVGMTIPV
jgi:CheY-like chemotaxis protein/ribonuclease BN (tRNA processing enzyme)